MEKGNLSRRAFVTGAAGVLAAAGLAGCAPQQKESNLASTGAATEMPESWDKEADVVVVGSGAAGAATATL